MSNQILFVTALLLLSAMAMPWLSRRPITKELMSLISALLCMGGLAINPSLVMLIEIAFLWAIRSRFESNSPFGTALTLGFSGLLLTILGGEINYGQSLIIGVDEVHFVKSHINPIATFAAIQLLLMQPTLLRARPMDGEWLEQRLSPILATALFICLAFLFGLSSQSITFDQSKLSSLSSIGFSEFIWLLVLIGSHALIVALIEESLFRGVLQTTLKSVLSRRQIPYRTALSIFFSNILFGLVHYKLGVGWMIGAAIGGVAYGIAHELAKGRIWAPVALHAGVVTILSMVMSNE